MTGDRNLRIGVLATLLALGPLNGTAAAADVSDPATGFAVSLPAGMSAVRAERPDQAATFGIRSDRAVPRMAPGSANLCQVAFRPAPQNAELTQGQINEMALGQPGQDNVRAAVGRTFRIEALEPFELRGARGLEIVGVPLAGPGAEGVRVVLSLLETPRGRLTMSCATGADDLEPGLRAFRELRDGVRMPD